MKKTMQILADFEKNEDRVRCLEAGCGDRMFWMSMVGLAVAAAAFCMAVFMARTPLMKALEGESLGLILLAAEALMGLAVCLAVPVLMRIVGRGWLFRTRTATLDETGFHVIWRWVIFRRVECSLTLEELDGFQLQRMTAAEDFSERFYRLMVRSVSGARDFAWELLRNDLEFREDYERLAAELNGMFGRLKGVRRDWPAEDVAPCAGWSMEVTPLDNAGHTHEAPPHPEACTRTVVVRDECLEIREISEESSEEMEPDWVLRRREGVLECRQNGDVVLAAFIGIALRKLGMLLLAMGAMLGVGGWWYGLFWTSDFFLLAVFALLMAIGSCTSILRQILPVRRLKHLLAMNPETFQEGFGRKDISNIEPTWEACVALELIRCDHWPDVEKDTETRCFGIALTDAYGRCLMLEEALTEAEARWLRGEILKDF